MNKIIPFPKELEETTINIRKDISKRSDLRKSIKKFSSGKTPTNPIPVIQNESIKEKISNDHNITQNFINPSRNSQ